MRRRRVSLPRDARSLPRERLELGGQPVRLDVPADVLGHTRGGGTEFRLVEDTTERVGDRLRCSLRLQTQPVAGSLG